MASVLRAALFAKGMAKLRSRSEARKRRRRCARLEHLLLVLTLGDHEKAARLVAFEAERAPDASREQLLGSAIERWRRDRR